ncbi:four-carbon acid sugar kinase family protein [Acidisoma cellulosilytica]|uniref:Four-carbon acid sugar kinase family protein n=1 Tax=Acidisoma cellulosilyticum TaxID=2802395 RepID=A0A964E584_9PROT|nr:four-carbon acid sugar kinase family protein [Acidisoma cellulosilyticum]MCB8882239.1 four-carbon acid sugar kinase family protein [Acidisoma cellulosilyticum]
MSGAVRRPAEGDLLSLRTPQPSWLILADDLTGAADSAIAFVRHGWRASVSWGVDVEPEAVVAIDADSRRLTATEAAARHRSLLQARYAPGLRLFKKIDSTLRGQPAAELSATVRLLREAGQGALSVVAPAFPETGRTTEGGGIRLQGQALEDTALWARDHSYPTANLVSVLTGEGLRVAHLSLDALRDGALAQRLPEAIAAGLDALVCDAATPADMDLIARATLPWAEQLFWTGSGGLALALARAESTPASAEVLDVKGGILFVVGSIAEASRAAAAVVAAEATVIAVTITPTTLRAGSGDAAWQTAGRQIADALQADQDVLVSIAPDSDADLAQGADLARRLGEILRPAAPHIGALFATGGETALALLDALSVTGIRLVAEIEAGVPLGLTRGALTIPVVTKAGAFGDAGTLHRCLMHLRRLRPRENGS